MKRIWHILILGVLIAAASLLWSRVTPALTLPSTVAQWSIGRAGLHKTRVR
jgi:hypothetical protein